MNVAKGVMLGTTLVAMLQTAAGEGAAVRHFDGGHLLRVALPMGGIGCG